jgi:cullin-associated NEDD8-dissociated protein 1
LLLVSAAAAASATRVLTQEEGLKGSVSSPTVAPAKEAPANSTPSAARTAAAEQPSDAAEQPLLPGQVTNPTRRPTDPAIAAELPGGRCPAYVDTQKWRTTDFTDTLNATVSISPKRAPANVPTGQWIQGRATYYGTDDRLEKIRVACGEPKDQFGIVAQGSCGYTNSDGSLPFPREVYAAAADTNEDYPGSCGRCYEVSSANGHGAS